MRGQIIDSFWDEDRGVATLIKATPYGTFVESCEAAPEDRDIMTSWDGFHFAEMKCNIQAMRAKAKQMRQRAIGAENALKALDKMNSNAIDEEGYPVLDSYTLDKLERQVRAAFREADKCQENYEEARGAYQAYTDILLNRRRALRNKVSNINPED